MLHDGCSCCEHRSTPAQSRNHNRDNHKVPFVASYQYPSDGCSGNSMSGQADAGLMGIMTDLIKFFKHKQKNSSRSLLEIMKLVAEGGIEPPTSGL